MKVVSLAVLIILVFESGAVHPSTQALSHSAFQYLASVGVSTTARVPENELNAITTKLTARERELDAREAELREREIAAREFGGGTSVTMTYVLSVILFILTTLIVVNYYLDWIRSRKQHYEALS